MVPSGGQCAAPRAVRADDCRDSIGRFTHDDEAVDPYLHRRVPSADLLSRLTGLPRMFTRPTGMNVLCWCRRRVTAFAGASRALMPRLGLTTSRTALRILGRSRAMTFDISWCATQGCMVVPPPRGRGLALPRMLVTPLSAARSHRGSAIDGIIERALRAEKSVLRVSTAIRSAIRRDIVKPVAELVSGRNCSPRTWAGRGHGPDVLTCSHRPSGR